MGLYKTKAETGFYKRQLRIFHPEPEYFFTIPVPVEMEPEIQFKKYFLWPNMDFKHES